MSAGQTGGNGTFDATLWEATPDGTIQFFTTNEQLVAEDTDSVVDIYQRAAGITTLVSKGEYQLQWSVPLRVKRDFGGRPPRLLPNTGAVGHRRHGQPN